jgi:SAM-dependent methyltransferase
MSDEVSVAVEGLVLPGRLSDLALEDGQILSVLSERDASRNVRFEGLYGRLYNRVIQTPTLRRAVFSLWGSADPLYALERFVADAVRGGRSASTDPVLVDVPSGGGMLLPMLAREGFGGIVVEVDLAAVMLRRAAALHHGHASGLRAVFVRCDALALPLRDEVADVVVSINGLHVVSDHARLLAEIARITKPGGTLWLITPVDGPGIRSKAILAIANALEITPRTPPTVVELRRLLAEVGFSEPRSYGGTSITGLACRRR